MSGFYYRHGPMEVIQRKAKLAQEDVDEICLVILLALDAAKRGLAPHSLSNTLCEHLFASAILWKTAGNKALMDRAQDAWDAMAKACARPGDKLALTTKEYQALRVAFGYFLRNLGKIEAGKLVDAYGAARKHMGLA